MKENGESKYQYFKDRERVRETKILMRNFSTGSKVHIRKASRNVDGLWNHVLIFKGVIVLLFYLSLFLRQNDLNSF